jgi:hypothetical protein
MSYALDFAPEARVAWRGLVVALQEAGNCLASRGCRAAGGVSESGSKRRSRGARGDAAQGHATRGPGVPAPAGASPRLRSEFRSPATRLQKALRPLRPRRASAASASPAERGAPRLRRFAP